MSKELREFCDTVLRYPHSYSMETNHLAVAWVAEHPVDDETLVDVEWCKTLRALSASVGYSRFWVTVGEAGVFGIYFATVESPVVAVMWVGNVRVESPTRGNVRRLAKALKFDLKETA